MLNQTIAVNYATVILNKKNLDVNKLYNTSVNLINVFREHPLLEYSLKNQFVSNSDKEDLFFRSIEVDEQTKSVFEFIFRTNKANYIPLILTNIIKIYRDKNKIGEAEIISSSELSKTILSNIVDSIKKEFKLNDVIVTLKIDKKIINGYKICINNKMLDLTIENILNKIKKQLSI